MKRYTKIFIAILKFSFARALIDRVSLFAGVILVTVWQLQHLASMAIFTNRFGGIAGWNSRELMVLACAGGAINGVLHFLVWPSLTSLSTRIVDGDLDRILLRPVNSMFMSSLLYFGFHNLINGISYFVVMLVFLGGVSWSGLLGFLGFGFLGGLLTYFIWIFMITFSFRFGKIFGIFDIIATFRRAGNYPLQAYRNASLIMMVMMVPFVLYSSVPASFLVGKVQGMEVGIFLGCVGVIGAAAVLFWKYQVRKYTGAGG